MSLGGLTASATSLNIETQNPAKSINWWNDNLPASKFADAMIGDKLTVTVSAIAEGQSDGYVLVRTTEGSGKDLQNRHPIAPGVVVFVIDAEILEAAQKGFLQVQGCNYSYTSIDLVCPSNVNVDTQSPAKSINWWNDNLPASKFTYAKIGDMLAVTVSAIAEGQPDGYVLVRTTEGSGKDLQNRHPTAPGVVEFVIDAEILEAAQKGFLQVQGCNYSYTSIDLVYAPRVAIGTAEYATFSYNEKLDLTGIDAYAVSAIGKNASLTSIEGNKVAANTGMILYKKNGGLVRIPFTTDNTDAISNSLIGTATGAVVDPSNAYVLANKSQGVGFYKLASAQAIAANKAYLTIAAGARGFIGFGESETTSIIDVRSKTEDIRREFFDLSGRKVIQPKKGLYIVNGEKVIIK